MSRPKKQAPEPEAPQQFIGYWRDPHSTHSDSTGVMDKAEADEWLRTHTTATASLPPNQGEGDNLIAVGHKLQYWLQPIIVHEGVAPSER